MALYKPSELRNFLDSIGRSPKKSLSQNFLIDGNIIRNIVRFADVQTTDQILEIGPGPGALTEALLATKASVTAVEMDHVLADQLLRLQLEENSLKVINSDILSLSYSDILELFPNPKQPPKIIANLPYHITTAVFVRFAPCPIEMMVLMVQKEVAERLVAKPKTAAYGSISVFLNFYGKISYGFTVSRECFYPKPNVDSAIVKFIPHPSLLAGDPSDFFLLTRTAFQQRRKTLKNALKNLYENSEVEAALNELALSPLVRAEELSVEQFVALYQRLVKNKK